MKPQLRDYIWPAVIVVFGLNYLFSYIQTNIKSGYAIVLLMIVTLVQVGVAAYAVVKHELDTRKFKIQEEIERMKQIK